MPSRAYIVEAVRSPLGRKNGSLVRWHPADVSALVLRALIDRSGIEAGEVDDVIWGCLDQVAGQAHDVARTGWLAAGLPEHVPGVTVDRQCGSSQQAVHFAAQAVMSGTQDLVVAGGVQCMNMIPMNSAVTLARPLGYDNQFDGSEGWALRYGHQEISQFRGAELLAKRWSLSRREMEEFALRSNERAIAAIEAGRFAAEIVPAGDFVLDETPRRGTTLEKMASLAPIREDGLITPAMASQIADGSAALLIASEAAVVRLGLKPRARIAHISVRADDPVVMLSAPISATRHALNQAGMELDQIDLIEINEAFAPVVLAWARDLGADMDRVNVNGGAIALGHALGATGARLMVSLLHELERRSGRYGLQTMCEAGGQANVTIIERL